MLNFSKAYSSRVAIISLVATNVVPLFGVMFWGWDAFSIVLLYWAENVIIGFYNVLKMAIARVNKPIEHLVKLFIIPFFMVHYGGFAAVHGLFVLAMFGKKPELFGHGGPHMPCFFIFFELLVNVIQQVLSGISAAMTIALAGLAASHGVSFVMHFLAGGEYRKTDPGSLMAAPYARVVVMHIAILAGGFLSMSMRSPMGILLLLVAMKTFIDVKMHIREHEKIRMKEVKVKV